MNNGAVALADAQRGLQRAWETWKEAVEAQEPEPAETESGIPIAPVYTPLDLRDDDYLARVGLPGIPRTRAASTGRCTAGASGRCASTPAGARPRTPTSASATCSSSGQTGPLRRARPADPDGL